MTPQKARERVARGAALLDEKKPGWAERIDAGTLTLHDPCGCVIGQLCRKDTFTLGIESLGLSSNLRDAPAHGFDLLVRECANASANWRLLKDAWLEAIADRVSAAPLATWTHRETAQA